MQKDWEIVLGIVAIVGVAMTAATLKEGRALICRQSAALTGQAFMCDAEAQLRFQAFQYRASADGISAADACSPDLRVDTILAEGQAIDFSPVANTAICWELTVTHADLAEAISVPAQLVIETPQPVFVNRMDGSIRRERPEDFSGGMGDELWREANILTFKHRQDIRLDDAIVTQTRHRLLITAGDASQWPPGAYKATLSADGIATGGALTAGFTLRPQ